MGSAGSGMSPTPKLRANKNVDESLLNLFQSQNPRPSTFPRIPVAVQTNGVRPKSERDNHAISDPGRQN